MKSKYRKRKKLRLLICMFNSIQTLVLLRGRKATSKLYWEWEGVLWFSFIVVLVRHLILKSANWCMSIGRSVSESMLWHEKRFFVKSSKWVFYCSLKYLNVTVTNHSIYLYLLQLENIYTVPNLPKVWLKMSAAPPLIAAEFYP